MAIGDPYISRDELKLVLGITDSSEDALVTRAVNGATRAIDNKSAYSTFWKTATAVARVVETEGRVLYKRGLDPHYKLLLPDGIASATGFSVDGVTAPTLVDPSLLDLGKPVTAIRLPYSWYRKHQITITAFWGWPELPDDIVMATQMQAQRYYKRRGSPEGIAGSAEWGMVRIPRLDPDVQAIMEAGGYMALGIG